MESTNITTSYYNFVFRKYQDNCSKLSFFFLTGFQHKSTMLSLFLAEYKNKHIILSIFLYAVSKKWFLLFFFCPNNQDNCSILCVFLTEYQHQQPRKTISDQSTYINVLYFHFDLQGTNKLLLPFTIISILSSLLYCVLR